MCNQFMRELNMVVCIVTIKLFYIFKDIFWNLIWTDVQFACNEFINIFSGCENMYIHLKLHNTALLKQETLWCSLTSYMKSVHERVPYSCNQCDYRYGCSLKSHTKSFHEGVPYSCDHCDCRSIYFLWYYSVYLCWFHPGCNHF